MNGDVIDIGGRLAGRNAPDDDCVWQDPKTGLNWFMYLVDFVHNGEVYTLDIWALSEADADAKLQALKSTGQMMGQVLTQEGRF